MVNVFFLGLIALLAVGCGDSEARNGPNGAGAGGGPPNAGASGRGGAGGTNASGGTGGAVVGRGGSGGSSAAGTGGVEDGGASGEAGTENEAGATSGGSGGAAGSGAAAGAGGMGGSATLPLGPRCLDCETLCLDDALSLPQPMETCTEPSLFSGLGVRIDLEVTLSDGSMRYLVDSPFDYESDHYPSWSYDSLGSSFYKLPVVCGEVSLTNLAVGTAEPESRSIVVVTVEGTAYRSDLAPASVMLESGGLVQGSRDEELGPMFDMLLSGTLVSEAGTTLEVEGRVRNVAAGLGERGLPRYTAPSQGGVLNFSGLAISGDDVIAGPFSLNAGTTGALVLDADLATATSVPLADHVLRLAVFPDGGWLGTGNLDNFLAAFEPSGTLRWRTPAFQGDWLFTTYETPLARSDGSGCIAIEGPSFADPERPAVLACSDASGGLAFEKPVHPIVQPLSPTELEDGTVLLLDARSPAIRGYAPDGTERIALQPCTPPPSGAQTPYFSMAPAARNTGGGAVAAMGQDLVAFDADGTLRFRSFVGRSYASEPLVAADGTIYAYVGYDAGLVALDPEGRVKWTRPLGSSGSPVGLAEDGTIYVVSWGWSGYGLLTAVRADGSVAWSDQTTWNTWRLAPNGDLYAYASGLIEHVRGDSPMADAPWPAPRGGARRAGTR